MGEGRGGCKTINMFQVRIHGRGGQGVVTAAEVLSVAAFLDGQESQAFPSFGAERMGAPVVAFCRIDQKPIRAHEPVSTPDAVIVQDPTLLRGGVDVVAGLARDGFFLINSDKTIEALGLSALAARLPAGRARVINAGAIAAKHLGRPLPNTPLLGAFVGLTDAVRLESLLAALREKFPGEMGIKNAAAAEEAYREMNLAVASA